MKIKNRIFLLTCSVLLATYSCSEDFFTEPAGNRIKPGDHYNSQTELEISIYGLYVPMQKAMPKLLLVDGLRSDLMDLGVNGDLSMKELNEQVLSVGNPYIDGSDFYKVIVNANEILANIEKVYKNDPPDDTARVRFVKGQILNIRAWNYFTLAKMFGKAAYFTDNMSSLPASQVFLEKKILIDTLINQLKPFVYRSTTTEEYYLDGPNTSLLLGELYLENDQYDSAAFYLKRGIESYGNKDFFKVTRALQDENWKLIFMNDPTRWAEIKDLVFFDTYSKQKNEFTTWSLKYMIKPSNLLVDAFNVQSLSTGELGDLHRGKGVTFDTIPGTNNYYIGKYALEKVNPYGATIILSRAADAHLLLAEALNRLGDYTTALLFVNKGISEGGSIPGFNKWVSNLGVRGRVGLTPREIPADVDTSNTIAVMEAVEDIILEERALELAFEGKRWFDLVRVAERRGESYLADRVARKYSDPNLVAKVRGILMNKQNWYLPTK